MRFDAILFDFDGVLLESEHEGNRHIAEYLTGIGRPTTAQDAAANFTGLAGSAFLAAVEQWLGKPIPQDFHGVRETENRRLLAEGIGEVRGAAAFVRSLPHDMPYAICSSSSTHWIRTHLRNLGLHDIFGEHVYSGQEHVAHGKPAPDIYLYAADRLAVPIERCAILEDSPVGATAAVASGAFTIGFCAGLHCGADHGRRLREIGVDAVATDFEEVRRLID